MYNLLYPHMNFFVKRFFRQFRYYGFEKIPKNEAVILAPNHQNAFLDAIVMTYGLGWKNQLSFLVRASIFKKPLAAKFLYSLNMLPVYRKDHDGMENMDKNDEVFDNCIYLLKNKRPLMLFPEATHTLRRRLLPLKKGVTRIAFSAEEQNDFALGVKIYPIGINYSTPRDFYGDLLMKVGEPIHVSEYLELYKESPAKAHARIRTELEARMRELMIDIRTDEHYELVEGWRQMDANNKGIDDVEKEFDNAKQLIARAEKFIGDHPEEVGEWHQKMAEYRHLLNRNKLSDKHFSPSAPRFNPVLSVLLTVLLSPFIVFGGIHNFFPFVAARYIVKKYIKDPGFQSSIKVAVAAFMFPVLHILCCLIYWMLSGSFGGALLYWFVILFTGEVALWYYLKWEQFNLSRRTAAFIQTPDGKEAVSLRRDLSLVLDRF